MDSLIGSVGGLFGKLENHNLPGDIADLNATTQTLAGNTATLRKLIAGFVTAFGDFSRITQNGNWANVYPCKVYAQTFGTPSISMADGVSAVDRLAGAGARRAGRAGSALGTAALAALALPIPVQLPTGRVGSATKQTAVCRCRIAASRAQPSDGGTWSAP